MPNFAKTAIVAAVISAGAFISRSAGGADDVPLARAILKKEAPSPEEKIIAALDKPTNVEFLDLALEDCLQYLKEYHGINIWLDRQATSDEGIALDQPITLKLSDAKLESVLNLLLQGPELDWIIQDEVLKITTVEWTYNHPETRTYDIQNLIEAGHSPEELIAAISKCVEPGTWTGKNATGGISHTGGVLVVRHTQRAHREIVGLIADLDEIADVGIEERADGKKDSVVSIRVYSTFDQPAEKMAEALQEFIARNSWKNRNDRDDGGEVRALKGALVVKQTASVHRSIQSFLAQFEPQSPVVQEERAPAGPPSTTQRPAHDPFGVLGSAGRPIDSQTASRRSRPKSPLKKGNRGERGLSGRGI